MNLSARGAGIMIAMLARSSIFAQLPDPRAVQPERPTVATHASTVATGYLEIETGVERDRLDPRAIGYGVPTVLKIGVASRGQLSVGVPIDRPPSGDLGLGDMSVGLKWRVVRGAPVVGDLSILPSVKLPTGSEVNGTGTGTTDVSFLAISSHSFHDVEIDMNVGYTHRGGDGSNVPRNATLWTVSSGGPLEGAVGWVVECYGYPGTGGRSGQRPIVAMLFGPTFPARTWLALDAGVILPVNGPQPRAFYAGAVYNVGRIWPMHP